MTWKDCRQEIRMNKICDKPIQSATRILKHVVADNVPQAFASVGRVASELQTVRTLSGAKE